MYPGPTILIGPPSSIPPPSSSLHLYSSVTSEATRIFLDLQTRQASVCDHIQRVGERKEIRRNHYRGTEEKREILTGTTRKGV